MIKVIWAAHRRPGLSDEEFYRLWHDVHGPFYTRTTPGLRRYIQHHTLAQARGGDPAPTHDGASIGWFDDLATLRNRPPSPVTTVQGENGDTPFARPMSVVVATERVVVDGPTRSGMVKAIWIARRKPGLSDEEFFSHWYDVHGALWSKVPGVRRYVQNHALPEARDGRNPTLTHDGWSEMWFDDLESMRQVMAAPERQAPREDGLTLFERPMDVVVAKESPIVP
jgi:uncharacterized protein (TIGR02118 family)